MKLSAALLIGFSSGLFLSTLAMAQPFNDRGDLLINIAPTGPQEMSGPVTPTPNRFKERNGFFLAEAPSGSEQTLPPVRATPQSFNNREHVAEGTILKK